MGPLLRGKSGSQVYIELSKICMCIRLARVKNYYQGHISSRLVKRLKWQFQHAKNSSACNIASAYQ